MGGEPAVGASKKILGWVDVNQDEKLDDNDQVLIWVTEANGREHEERVRFGKLNTESAPDGATEHRDSKEELRTYVEGLTRQDGCLPLRGWSSSIEVVGIRDVFNATDRVERDGKDVVALKVFREDGSFTTEDVPVDKFLNDERYAEAGTQDQRRLLVSTANFLFKTRRPVRQGGSLPVANKLERFTGPILGE